MTRLPIADDRDVICSRLGHPLGRPVGVGGDCRGRKRQAGVRDPAGPDLARGAAPADVLAPRLRDMVQLVAEEFASMKVARFLGIKPQ
jgi:hypothetical protein